LHKAPALHRNHEDLRETEAEAIAFVICKTVGRK
jgi:hypothetical protein